MTAINSAGALRRPPHIEKDRNGIGVVIRHGDVRRPIPIEVGGDKGLEAQGRNLAPGAERKDLAAAERKTPRAVIIENRELTVLSHRPVGDAEIGPPVSIEVRRRDSLGRQQPLLLLSSAGGGRRRIYSRFELPSS